MKKQHSQELSVVYGMHPVMELLKQKRRKIFELFVSKEDPSMLKQFKALLPQYPVTIHQVGRELLASKAGSTEHQGVVAYAELYTFRKKFFDPTKEEFLVMLDGVQDVRN